jgi:hypothetical protein
MTAAMSWFDTQRPSNARNLAAAITIYSPTPPRGEQRE